MFSGCSSFVGGSDDSKDRQNEGEDNALAMVSGGGGGNDSPTSNALVERSSSPFPGQQSTALVDPNAVPGPQGTELQPYGSPPKRRGVRNEALWERSFKATEFYPNPAPVPTKENPNPKIVFKPLEAKLDDAFFVRLYPLLTVKFKLPIQSNIYPSKLIDSDDRGFVSIREYATKSMIKRFSSGFGCVKIINFWEVMGGKFQLIATGSTDNFIRVFDIEGKCLRKIEDPHNGKRVTAMLTLQDQPYEETYIVSGGEDCAVRFWGLKSAKLLWECLGHRCRIVSICWAIGLKVPGMAIFHKYLVSMDRSGEIRLWSPTDGHCIRIINLCQEDRCEIPDPLKVVASSEEKGGKMVKKTKKKAGTGGDDDDDDEPEEAVTATVGVSDEASTVSISSKNGKRGSTPNRKASISGGRDKDGNNSEKRASTPSGKAKLPLKK